MLNKIAERWDEEVIIKLEGMKERIDKGEATEDDTWQIFNLERFTFLYDLMMNSTIEENGTWVNGVNPLDPGDELATLAEKVYAHTKKTRDETLDLLQDLFLRKGLKFTQDKEQIRWEWNEYLD